MPARPSNALQDFRASLKLAERLIALEGRYKDPPPPTKRQDVEGLRGAAAVLMIAALEQFLRAAAKEHFDSLRTRQPQVVFARLPDRMRVASVFTSLERALKGPEFTKTKRAERLADVQAAARDAANETVNASAIGETAGNPGPETLKTLLNHFDIEDPFAALQPRFRKMWKAPVASSFVRDTLESLLNRRHTVAHTGDVSGVSRTDLREALRFVRVLACTVDDELRIKVNKVYRSAK